MTQFQTYIMEPITICLTALIIGFLLIGNLPTQMLPEAWGYALATVFFAVIGGRSPITTRSLVLTMARRIILWSDHPYGPSRDSANTGHH